MVVELLKGLGSLGSRAKSRGLQSCAASCTAVGLAGGGRPSECRPERTKSSTGDGGSRSPSSRISRPPFRSPLWPGRENRR